MGIIKDPTSWRAGFELGLAGFSFPYSKPRRKPTAYLYNGIRLPALPEWDRGVYPFACLCFYSASHNRGYAYMFTSPPKYERLEKNVDGFTSVQHWLRVDTDISHISSMFSVEDSAFDVISAPSTGDVIVGEAPFWTNFYMYDVDGNLHLVASDPVPVYE